MPKQVGVSLQKKKKKKRGKILDQFTNGNVSMRDNSFFGWSQKLCSKLILQKTAFTDN